MSHWEAGVMVAVFFFPPPNILLQNSKLSAAIKEKLEQKPLTRCLISSPIVSYAQNIRSLQMDSLVQVWGAKAGDEKDIKQYNHFLHDKKKGRPQTNKSVSHFWGLVPALKLPFFSLFRSVVIVFRGIFFWFPLHWDTTPCASVKLGPFASYPARIELEQSLPYSQTSILLCAFLPKASFLKLASFFN